MVLPAFLFGQRRTSRVLLGLGMLLVIAVALLLTRAASVNSTRLPGGYQAEDLVYQNPLLAVHTVPGVQALTQAGGELSIPLDFYDFGKLSPEQTVRQQFVIANTGSAPLMILRAYTTCGCTQAEISASRIPPGKAALVTLTFDAAFHAASGTIRRGLIIETSDPRQPQAEIWIQARVR